MVADDRLRADAGADREARPRRRASPSRRAPAARCRSRPRAGPTCPRGSAAGVPMSFQYPAARYPYSPLPTRSGKISRSIETARPGGTCSITSRSSRYAPALIRFVGAGPGDFSRNASTAPSPSSGPLRSSAVSSTAIRHSVARAPVRSCCSRSAVRSMSVRTSPLRTNNRSSLRAPVSSASRNGPAVPSGSSSWT